MKNIIWSWVIAGFLSGIVGGAIYSGCKLDVPLPPVQGSVGGTGGTTSTSTESSKITISPVVITSGGSFSDSLTSTGGSSSTMATR